MPNFTGQTCFKRILVVLFTVSFTSYGTCHPPGELSNNQWVVSLQAGTAMILTEFTPDLSPLNNEFNHQPGLTLDFGLSRTFGKHWETGVDLSINRLNGKSDLPDFSAIGNHNRFMNLFQLPVQYKTTSASFYTFIRYYFKNYPNTGTDNIRIDPFVEAGAGINQFKTLISYQETPPGTSDPTIFMKGQGRNPIPGSSAQYTFGAGTRMNFKKDWNLLVSLDMDIVNSDCMDAVHNYDVAGNRNDAKTILPRLKVGVAIPITNPLRHTKEYLPWTFVK